MLSYSRHHTVVILRTPEQASGTCERPSRRLVPLKSTKASKFWPDSGYEVGWKLSSNSVKIEYYS